MEQQHFRCLASEPHKKGRASSGTGSYAERSSFGPSSLETGPVPGYPEHLTFPLVPVLLSDMFNDFSDLWMWEVSTDSSPLSPSSSTSHTGSLPSLSPTGMPAHLAFDSPVFSHAQPSCKIENFSGNRESCWIPNQFDLLAWVSRQLSRAYHNHSAYDETFLEPIRDCMLELDSPSTSNYISYCEPVLSRATGAGGFASSQQNVAISADISEKDSFSKSEYTDSDAPNSSHESMDCTIWQYEAKPGGVELGRWGPIRRPFHTAREPRYYECSHTDKKEPHSICARKFQRLGHLRRHIATVHGTESCHLCKVCSKSFSRHDNLREHYWTHLRRGGKAGRNTKMSLLELSAILGPMERRLVKRLQTRLNSVRAKETKAKSLRKAI